MRPGVQVVVRDSPPARSAPIDVGVWFVSGVTEAGPDKKPVLIRSSSEMLANFGQNMPWTPLWDAVDAFFREGGSKVWVSRVVGAGATKATATIGDFKADGKGSGDFYEQLEVELTVATGPPATYTVKVWQTTPAVLLEQSPAFTEKAQAVAWSSGSKFVTLTDNDVADTSTPSVAVPKTPLAGGDDDRASITDANYLAALDMFSAGLGPGQVSVPGLMTSTIWSGLLKHAYDFNRVAYLDGPDNALASSLISAGVALRTDTNARYGGMFAPPAIIPGDIPNTTKQVPYSAIQAAMTARIPNPNQPAAGVNGMSRVALSVKYDYTDTERSSLNDAGVDIARNMFGGVRTYGYRTLVDPNVQPEWLQLNAIRTVMTIKAEADEIAERHIFMQIDGKGLEISAFHGDLVGMLIPFYETGALYGETPDEAFYVDTGSQVNTPATVADGQLRAVIGIRTSPFAELVYIEIVKLPLPTAEVGAVR